jgi:hypothetical protein
MKIGSSLLALAMAACGSNGGQLTVQLTDTPGDFKAAVVTITQINLVGPAGMTVLSSTKVTTDLLTLQNSITTLVNSASVPPGTYNELDIVISGGYVEVEQAGGSSIIYASSATYEGLPAGASVGGTLRMPSFGTSGLKVNLPGGNVDVTTTAKVLLVDFDVQQSFGQDAGNSGAWVMHPVMTATDFSLSGSLEVTAKLASTVTLPASLTLGSFDAVLTNAGGSKKTLQLTV